MTYGTLAGLMLSDLALGRANRFASLYDATRVKPVAAAKDYVTENIDFPVHFVKDRLTNRDVEGRDPGEVPRGSGRILAIDGRKYAVYKDHGGEIHSFSPVCPHMGCDVAWNRAEGSWDCPCHGSRFAATGEVVNGPAVNPLSPVPLPHPAER
jgi:Rieske Fe-S protein